MRLLIWLLLFSSLWARGVAYGTNLIQMSDCEPSQLTYCDLVKNPGKYDGQEVTVKATYRYGFEWQEMLCLECREVGQTWLEFVDVAPEVKTKLKKMPRSQGTINAVFTGTFRSSQGPFGDGGYSFKFEVRAIKDIQVISKDGWAPDKLAPNERKKVCGAGTSQE